MGRFSLLSKAQQPPHEDRPASKAIEDGEGQDPVEAPNFLTGLDETEDSADEADTPPAFDLLDAKLRVHNKLIDELDLSMLDKLDETEMKRQVRRLVTEIVREERIPMNQAEVAQFADSVYDEMTGLGPPATIINHHYRPPS